MSGLTLKQPQEAWNIKMVSSEGWGVQLKHIATVPGGSGSKEEGKN
jgi:hypothetical protein